MIARGLCLVLLLSACSRGGSSTRSPMSGSSLLDHLPAGASMVVGLTRTGSEAALAAGLKKLPLGPMGDRVPPCALQLLSKIEATAVAIEAAPAPRLSFVVRGARLRPAFEACLHAVLPQARWSQERKATRYEIEGDAVYLLWLDDATLVGGPVTDVEATSALAAPRAPLSRDARMKPLLAHVRQTSALWFAADLGWLPARWLTQGPVQAWGEMVGSDLTLRLVMGTPDEAGRISATLEKALEQAPPQVAAAARDVGLRTEGTTVTIRAPMGKLLAEAGGVPEGQIAPELTAIATLGVVSAVAVPAFMKYARKAKTAEAVVGVRRMFDGARAFYEQSHRMPPGTAVTPPLGACCRRASRQCAPDPGQWQSEGWRAIHFSMTDPHRYSYQIESAADAFTVRAYGDLDCDGVYSTFEMAGHVGADGHVAAPPRLSVLQELE